MKQFVMSEKQVEDLIEMAMQACLENAEVDANVEEGEICIKRVRSRMSFDDATQIASNIGFPDMCHALAKDVWITH